jgi:hypothetical protein
MTSRKISLLIDRPIVKIIHDNQYHQLIFIICCVFKSVRTKWSWSFSWRKGFIPPPSNCLWFSGGQMPVTF